MNRRLPVIIAGTNCLSGVTSWADQLRTALADHPRYDVQTLYIGPDLPKSQGADRQDISVPHVGRSPSSRCARLAPAIVIPNYVWSLFLAGFEPDIRCVGMCHADSVDQYYRPLSWYEPTITKYIAVSKECHEYLSGCVPCREEDIVTLPYGVCIPPSLNRNYQIKPLRLIYAGRVTQPQKRVWDFVPLVENLLRAKIPFVFDIVGEGDEFAPLAQIMRSRIPAANVYFHSRVPHREMARKWLDHDIFLQVSDFEGTSVSMLEAMAHGVVPVVTAASSGIAGVIKPQDNGFVVPVGDMSAMANVIAQLAGKHTLLADVGQSAHRTAHEYSMDSYAQKFTQVLDQVAEAEENVDFQKRYGIYSPMHPLLVQQQLIKQQQVEIDDPKARRVHRLFKGGLKRWRRANRCQVHAVTSRWHSHQHTTNSIGSKAEVQSHLRVDRTRTSCRIMSRAIIVTGMHRSGTSLVTSLLQNAGMHIGDNLIAANVANPRGYFEDVDFYEYHESLLHQRGQTYLHVDNNFDFQATDAETERARQLIAERSQRPLWGWKDPRTSLFLDFWHQLLPEGRFLFVYRHPIEVLLSLLRRGEFDSHPSLMSGLNAWYKYNSNIRAFFDRHPDRCLLVHIDGVVKQSAKFASLVHEKLQLDSRLDEESLGRIFHANELQKTSFAPELTNTLARLYPELLELYQQLNEKADLRGDEIQSDSTPSAYLSQLANFTEQMAEPISAPVKHSVLQLLLSSQSPEFTGRMFDRFDHSAKEMQQKVDWLWLEVQRLQRLDVEQNSELDRLQRLVTEQSQTLDSLQWLNMEQSQELEGQSARIESLVAELDSIRGTRIWKAMQSYRKLKERWTNAA